MCESRVSQTLVSLLRGGGVTNSTLHVAGGKGEGVSVCVRACVGGNAVIYFLLRR